MKFNPQTALYYAACIARPRRVGSREEKLVATELHDLLNYFGYRVTEQEFTFANAQNSVIGILLIVNIVLIGFGLSVTAWAWLSGLMMFALFSAFPQILKATEQSMIAQSESELGQLWKRLGKTYTTQNLIGQPKDQPSHKTKIYLMAHYDSKSQFIPIAVRIVLFAFVLGGSITFAGLTLLIIFFPALSFLLVPLGLGLSLASLPLAFIDVGNESPGAIDNASGVGLVLHLAEIITQRADLSENLTVTVLLPAAEEMGLLGAAAYAKYCLPPANKNETVYILNFDGVGVEGKLRYVEANNTHRPSRLLNLLKQSSAELKIPLSKFALIGALMDHIPFAQAGYDALSLTTFSGTLWWVHTAQDSPDKLHYDGLAQAGAVALRVIEKIAAPNN